MPVKKAIRKNSAKIKKGMSTGSKVAIGAGVAAFGAAAVGAYYLLGPNGKANKKKMNDLMGKMRREAITEFKHAKKLSIPVYNKAVDLVSENYARKYKVLEKDIKALGKKLKAEAKDVELLAKNTGKRAVTAAKRTGKSIKKAAKKSR